MKIACISTSQIPSNTANSLQVMKVCQSLVQVGASVRLWSPGNTTSSWEALSGQYGVTNPFEVGWVPSLRAFRRYDFALQAFWQARQWGADLVYTWLIQSAVFALWQGFPVVLELHDRPTGTMGPRMFRRYLHTPGKKRLLVITQALQEALEQRYGHHFLPGELQIAPNGADLEHYQDLPDAPAARQELGLAQGLTAVYSGHFYAGRGLELLFELARRLPQINFLWVGGRGEEVVRWRERLSQAGMSNVLLTGFVENRRLPLYQAAGDVLLMPYERSIAGSSGGNSVEICSPMKMFEYMAACRAIMASDLPVLHEVLNSNNAVFCPPENVDAWQQALAALLDDHPRRERLAAQARRDVARYTWRERAGRALENMV